MFSPADLELPLAIVLAAREGMTRRAVIDAGYSPGALVWVVDAARGLSAELRCGPKLLGYVHAKIEADLSDSSRYVLTVESHWHGDPR